MELLLKDKAVVITGSGRGIGLAAAKLFASEGASVVINDVDDEPAQSAKAEIEKAGGKAIIANGDVRKQQDTDRICKAAVGAFGKLDIIVNNAGTTRDKTVHNMTDDLWEFIIDIVLRGSFNMIRSSAPYMRDVAKQEVEKGVVCHRKIINMSSIAGLRGNSGQANYASAKAGLVGLTKTIAREWGRFNVNCNCIAPGAIETRLTKPKETPDSPVGLPPGALEMTKMMIPLNRVGQPEDIAKAALFLACHLSDYITGQVLVVDGGLM